MKRRAGPRPRPARAYYASLDVHRMMLRDSVRGAAFRAALQAAIRPGDVVLDVGAGTGILSLFALQSGASHVYAVEPTSIVRTMRAIVKANGVADRVSIIHSDIERASLPRKFDVIVFEWLGTMGVDENMLPLVTLARDRWLEPGGRLVPDRVTAWIAPIWSHELDTEREWETGRPYGIDFRAVSRPRVEMFRSWQTLAPADMPFEPAVLWTTDVTTVPTRVSHRAFRGSTSCESGGEGRINAVATWFEAHLGGGVVLTNSPAGKRTHWGYYLFPLRTTRHVSLSTTIDLKFACIPSGPGRSRFQWSIRGEDGAWQHHRAG